MYHKVTKTITNNKNKFTMKAANDFNNDAPYFFNEYQISLSLKKDGSLKQNKRFFNVIKKHHSTRIYGGGCTRYYLRVWDSQFGTNGGNPTVLVGIPLSTGGYSIKKID